MVEQKILGGSGDGGDGPEGGLRVGSGCFRGESDTSVMVVVSGVPLYVESGAVSLEVVVRGILQTPAGGQRALGSCSTRPLILSRFQWVFHRSSSF